MPGKQWLVVSLSFSVVTHVMGEVQRPSDRVGLIRDGTLAAEQSVESLRAPSVRRPGAARSRGGSPAVSPS